SLAGRAQTFCDLDLGTPGIGHIDDPKAGGIRATADGAVGLDSGCLQLLYEFVDIPDFKTHVIDGAALCRRLRRFDFAERYLCSRHIRGVKRRALSRRGAEMFDIPLLPRDPVRPLMVTVMHGHRSGDHLYL